MVAKNDVTFRCTSHKYKLNFMRGTKVWKFHSDEIPNNNFDFMSFQEIISKTNEDQMLGEFILPCFISICHRYCYLVI
jgi:hypothetical protein